MGRAARGVEIDLDPESVGLFDGVVDDKSRIRDCCCYRWVFGRSDWT